MRLRAEATALALFVAFGLCVEIAFTAVAAGARGDFRGEVSLLMVPVYAVAWALLGPGLRALRAAGLHAPAWRLPITVVAIYAATGTAGRATSATGTSRSCGRPSGWCSPRCCRRCTARSAG